MTEALLCAAQEQAIRTNYVKHYIDKTSESPLCRVVTKGFDRWIGKLGIPFNVGVNCLVGNCKDIEESVGNVKKRYFC